MKINFLRALFTSQPLIDGKDSFDDLVVGPVWEGTFLTEDGAWAERSYPIVNPVAGKLSLNETAVQRYRCAAPVDGSQTFL